MPNFDYMSDRERQAISTLLLVEIDIQNVQADVASRAGAFQRTVARIRSAQSRTVQTNQELFRQYILVLVYFAKILSESIATDLESEDGNVALARDIRQACSGIPSQALTTPDTIARVADDIITRSAMGIAPEIEALMREARQDLPSSQPAPTIPEPRAVRRNMPASIADLTQDELRQVLQSLEALLLAVQDSFSVARYPQYYGNIFADMVDTFKMLVNARDSSSEAAIGAISQLLAIVHSAACIKFEDLSRTLSNNNVQNVPEFVRQFPVPELLELVDQAADLKNNLLLSEEPQLYSYAQFVFIYLSMVNGEDVDDDEQIVDRHNIAAAATVLEEYLAAVGTDLPAESLARAQKFKRAIELVREINENFDDELNTFATQWANLTGYAFFYDHHTRIRATLEQKITFLYAGVALFYSRDELIDRIIDYEQEYGVSENAAYARLMNEIGYERPAELNVDSNAEGGHDTVSFREAVGIYTNYFEGVSPLDARGQFYYDIFGEILSIYSNFVNNGVEGDILIYTYHYMRLCAENFATHPHSVQEGVTLPPDVHAPNQTPAELMREIRAAQTIAMENSQISPVANEFVNLLLEHIRNEALYERFNILHFSTARRILMRITELMHPNSTVATFIAAQDFERALTVAIPVLRIRGGSATLDSEYTQRLATIASKLVCITGHKFLYARAMTRYIDVSLRLLLVSVIGANRYVSADFGDRLNLRTEPEYSDINVAFHAVSETIRRSEPTQPPVARQTPAAPVRSRPPSQMSTPELVDLEAGLYMHLGQIDVPESDLHYKWIVYDALRTFKAVRSLPRTSSILELLDLVFKWFCICARRLVVGERGAPREGESAMYIYGIILEAMNIDPRELKSALESIIDVRSFGKLIIATIDACFYARPMSEIRRMGSGEITELTSLISPQANSASRELNVALQTADSIFRSMGERREDPVCHQVTLLVYHIGLRFAFSQYNTLPLANRVRVIEICGRHGFFDLDVVRNFPGGINDGPNVINTRVSPDNIANLRQLLGHFRPGELVDGNQSIIALPTLTRNFGQIRSLLGDGPAVRRITALLDEMQTLRTNRQTFLLFQALYKRIAYYLGGILAGLGIPSAAPESSVPVLRELAQFCVDNLRDQPDMNIVFEQVYSGLTEEENAGSTYSAAAREIIRRIRNIEGGQAAAQASGPFESAPLGRDSAGSMTASARPIAEIEAALRRMAMPPAIPTPAPAPTPEADLERGLNALLMNCAGDSAHEIFPAAASWFLSKLLSVREIIERPDADAQTINRGRRLIILINSLIVAQLRLAEHAGLLGSGVNGRLRILTQFIHEHRNDSMALSADDFSWQPQLLRIFNAVSPRNMPRKAIEPMSHKMVAGANILSQNSEQLVVDYANTIKLFSDYIGEIETNFLATMPTSMSNFLNFMRYAITKHIEVIENTIGHFELPPAFIYFKVANVENTTSTLSDISSFSGLPLATNMRLIEMYNMVYIRWERFSSDNRGVRPPTTIMLAEALRSLEGVLPRESSENEARLRALILTNATSNTLRIHGSQRTLLLRTYLYRYICRFIGIQLTAMLNRTLNETDLPAVRIIKHFNRVIRGYTSGPLRGDFMSLPEAERQPLLDIYDEIVANWVPRVQDHAMWTMTRPAPDTAYTQAPARPDIDAWRVLPGRPAPRASPGRPAPAQPRAALVRRLRTDIPRIIQIRRDPDLIASIADPTPAEMIEAVSRKPEVIMNIRNRTQEAVAIAIRQRPDLARNLPGIYPAQKLDAITLNPSLIASLGALGSRTNEQAAWERAIKMDGLLIRHAVSANKATEALILSAVQQNGLALEHVLPQKQTAEIVAAAVAQNPLAIKHAHAPLITLDLAKAAVEKNIEAYAAVANKFNAAAKLELVRKSPGILRYIETQTEEMCAIAVSVAPLALEFAEKQTPSMVRRAVEVDARAWAYALPEVKASFSAADRERHESAYIYETARVEFESDTILAEELDCCCCMCDDRPFYYYMKTCAQKHLMCVECFGKQFAENEFKCPVCRVYFRKADLGLVTK
jgi:hypothetical protein